MKRFGEWTPSTASERELLERCREAVRGIEPTAELILYGSHARGDADIYSDYDLLVLVSRPLTPEMDQRIAFALYALERETDTVLSVQVYERNQWESRLSRSTPFYANVEREGVRI